MRHADPNHWTTMCPTPDAGRGNLLHPADPLVPDHANRDQLGAWWEIMERVNDHYDPVVSQFESSRLQQAYRRRSQMPAGRVVGFLAL